MTCRPADLIADELDKLRGEIEGLAKSDEDVLTYAMFPEIGKHLAAGTRRRQPQARTTAAAGRAQEDSRGRATPPTNSGSRCMARPITSS